MINLYEYTPSVYYNRSRDFQLLGRLYDVVLNYVKTNTDLVYNVPFNENTDEKLLDLLTLTLGFKSRHSYNINQLKAICSVFNLILRNKGSIKAIQIAGDALMHSEGLTGAFSCELNNNVLDVFIPQNLSDINLFIDLLDYILPAGITCSIHRVLREKTKAATIIVTRDKVTVPTVTYNKYDVIPRLEDTELGYQNEVMETSVPRYEDDTITEASN